ncbi:ABC transporter ATP-binding protein [Pedobacter sp. AW1-32]|uniref:ABC transporter ATP-binding protein n=1 Tax=Pedobacter sp. AW1-32 TaxID=3383026 RepID=UPI003FF0464E
MLQLSHFKKSYNGNLVLKIENLLLPKGIYWLQGRNGTGKSTFLKSIGGIISFKGNISVLDKDLKKQHADYLKQVNFAAAEPMFPEFLTGMEMVKMFAEAKHAPAKQEDLRIKEMGMHTYINQPVGTYSSGMLKKLSLVLAFIGHPKLTLLDEPLNALDVESLSVLYKWINKAYQENGTSFILSSHQEIQVQNLPESKLLLIENNELKMVR